MNVWPRLGYILLLVSTRLGTGLTFSFPVSKKHYNMRVGIVILTLAIATLDAILVQAAECTEEELTSITEIYESAINEGGDVCPDLMAEPEVSTMAYCDNSDCLDIISTMLGQMPVCSSGGLDMTAALQASLDYCETGTADTSEILVDTSSSSAEATASSSSSAFRTESSGSNTDTSSDKVTANTIPPPTDGSSSASSIVKDISTAAFVVTALVATISI